MAGCAESGAPDTVNTPVSRINQAYLTSQPKGETVTGKELTTMAVKLAHSVKSQVLVRHTV